MYLDSSYIAKYYVNEPDAVAVRDLIRSAQHVCSSVWASIEVASVCLRHVREGNLSEQQGLELMDLFRTHCEAGIWGLIPISDSLLRRTASLIRAIPPRTDLRAGDAIHLATALEQGESAIWTNDRHLLAAAACVGLQGRSAD